VRNPPKTATIEQLAGSEPPFSWFMDTDTVGSATKSKKAADAPTSISGPEWLKNRKAMNIVYHILNRCTWINCYLFTTAPTPVVSESEPNSADGSVGGGTKEVIILELRIASGHGARWYLPESHRYSSPGSSSSSGAVAAGAGGELKFRGFLEPLAEWGEA
jgi:hypothetical protein